MKLPPLKSKAFTLIELIVVIVILGILAAIAVPTFMKVIDNSKLKTAESTVGALARETLALAALDANGTVTEENVQIAFDDLNPSVEAFNSGMYAAGGYDLVFAPEVSTDANTISASLDDGTVGFSVYVPGAGCSYANGKDASVSSWSTRGAASDVCNGSVALAGESGDVIPNPEETETPSSASMMVLNFDTTLPGCPDATIAPPISGVNAGTIDWGDGSEVVTLADNPSHTYSAPGAYTVTVDGSFTKYGSGTNVDVNCLEGVTRWDDGTGTTDLTGAFYNHANFTTLAETPVTAEKMISMLAYAKVFNQPLNLDTRNVTDMSNMFINAETFNQPVTLDTSSVTNMDSMFASAMAFNSEVNFSDTSNVTRMYNMFYNARVFNQPLNFNTINVEEMGGMFSGAFKFNQPLDFNTSNVTGVDRMFNSTYEFAQDISHWDFSNVNYWGMNRDSYINNFKMGSPGTFPTFP